MVNGCWRSRADTLNPFIEFDGIEARKYLAFSVVLREPAGKAAKQ